jgi:8-oxo-dGTP pyrophosphatase MutT (NUDIX family)
MALLEATTNQFRGVVIKPESLPDNPDEFKMALRRSLDAWQSEGLLVVWLEVPIHRSVLIPLAVEAGFTFHHSNEGYLMMTLQLVPNAHVPPFATHYIGAGGVVLRDEKDLLVVCERHRQPGQAPFYKLPGGALLAGEHLTDAVVREVLEETGVHTHFDALVCFRHWHGYRYGKSDIYFVCRLHPLSQEITMQEEEIEDCLWMPVNDFLGSEGVSVFNKSIVSAALNSPGVAPSQIAGIEDGSREFFMPNL